MTDAQAHAMPDDELVTLALEGQMSAFEELVRRHRAMVFAVAARLVGPDEADDVTQDTFLRAFHRLGQYRGESSFRTWLLRIAHNSAITEITRRRPEPVGSSDEVDTDAGTELSHGPAEQLERSERRDRLATKIGQLRHEHRAVLVLRDLEGLSYQEIADVTQTPIGSVKGRLHRARDELIEILRHNTYDWEIPR